MIGATTKSVRVFMSHDVERGPQPAGLERRKHLSMSAPGAACERARDERRRVATAKLIPWHVLARGTPGMSRGYGAATEHPAIVRTPTSYASRSSEPSALTGTTPPGIPAAPHAAIVVRRDDIAPPARARKPHVRAGRGGGPRRFRGSG